jgi:hypothetical protein
VQQLVMHDLARADKPTQHHLVNEHPQLGRIGPVEYELSLKARANQLLKHVLGGVWAHPKYRAGRSRRSAANLAPASAPTSAMPWLLALHAASRGTTADGGHPSAGRAGESSGTGRRCRVPDRSPRRSPVTGSARPSRLCLPGLRSSRAAGLTAPGSAWPTSARGEAQRQRSPVGLRSGQAHVSGASRGSFPTVPPPRCGIPTLHSRSHDGGHYTVRVELHSQHLRVAVRDQGGPWAHPGDGDERHGRGLLIVSRLASSWGRDGQSADGWTVWFEMDRS